MSVAYFEEQRQEMIAAIKVIAEHLVAEIGKTALDDRVLRAMAKVPRHEFVPIEVQPYAYLNRPLPIGFDKTISQPFIVALMTRRRWQENFLHSRPLLRGQGNFFERMASSAVPCR